MLTNTVALFGSKYRATFGFFFSAKGVGQEVGKVSATDRDSGTNGDVRYNYLYAVDVNSKFKVDATTGSISTDARLDFEQIREHVLYIQASDRGFPSLSSKSQALAHNVRLRI